MDSTWSEDSLVPQTTVQDILDDDSLQDGLTFMDFLPECCKPAGFFSNPIFETFGSVVGRANDWLRENPHWEIKTCENVLFVQEGSSINYEMMAYVETQKFSTLHVRGLRLWIRKCEPKRKVGQQISYLNLVPQEIRKGGMFTSPVYESLDEVINRFNTMIRKEPLKGRIITIETQKMMITSPKETHPDISSWVKVRDQPMSFIFFIRIFFETTEAYSEEIGIVDFIPDMLEIGSKWKTPKLDLFPSIVNKASQWCSQQTDVRICNLQSIEIKIIEGKEINSQKMDFRQGSITYFARILRVAFTRSEMKKMMESSFLTQLTCKTFVPVQLICGVKFKGKHFETRKETKARISAWIKATDAQVVSVESIARRSYERPEKQDIHEESLTYHFGGTKQVWIHQVRVYMNGIYPEPPIGNLPLVPEIEDLSCIIQ